MSTILCAMLMTTSANVYHVSDYIQTISPHISRLDADRISTSIVYHSSQYAIDPFLVAAVIRQESNFRPLQRVCFYSKLYRRTFCDYGIGQINDIWVKAWKLDVRTLISDDDYNISVIVRVLNEMRSQYNADDWYGNYHDSRAQYKNAWLKLVNGWYDMLDLETRYECYADLHKPQITTRPARQFNQNGCAMAFIAPKNKIQTRRHRDVLVLAN
jgi:hypothetical protein